METTSVNRIAIPRRCRYRRNFSLGLIRQRSFLSMFDQSFPIYHPVSWKNKRFVQNDSFPRDIPKHSNQSMKLLYEVTLRSGSNTKYCVKYCTPNFKATSCNGASRNTGHKLEASLIEILINVLSGENCQKCSESNTEVTYACGVQTCISQP